jgi:hypothetical protein
MLIGCTLAVLALAYLGLVGPGHALAQGGPPGPGWVPTPGGGWVPPDHPLAAGLPPAPPGAPGGCHLHTLHGTYVFAASGFNIVAGVAVPKAIVEAIEFNGDGTLTVPAVTVSIGGAVTPASPGTVGMGTYTLNADCFGTLTFLPGPSFDIYAATSGTEGWMIQTNPNTVFQGTVKRISQ